MNQTREALRRQPRILIVDEDADNRQLLEIVLAREGFLLQTAASGEEALARVAQQPPDLILLDLTMPDMTGYEVLGKLKGDPANKNISVLILTALNDPATRILALSAGADDLLTKPLARLELCARVKSALALKLGATVRDVAVPGYGRGSASEPCDSERIG
jgi:DNA-binding response OmpR family regulator